MRPALALLAVALVAGPAAAQVPTPAARPAQPAAEPSPPSAEERPMLPPVAGAARAAQPDSLAPMTPPGPQQADVAPAPSQAAPPAPPDGAVAQPASAPNAAPATPADFGPDPNRGRLVALGGWTQSGRAACTQCHGMDGLGDASGAFPRLAGLDGWYLYKSLRDYASGARPNAVMTPVARALSDREMQDVAAHYAGFTDLPYAPPAAALDTATLQKGAAIVAVGLPDQGVAACSSCHGENGAGGGVAYPRIAGQSAPYVERQLRLWKTGGRDGDPMNVMEQVAKAMSDDDIAAVAAWLATVDPGPVPTETAATAAPAGQGAAGSVEQGTDAKVSPATAPGTAAPPADPAATPPWLPGAQGGARP